MARGWGRLAATLAVALLTANAAAAQTDWHAEWAQVLAAARKEGKVVVSGPPGEIQRQAIVSSWEKAYPDIALDYSAARGTQVLAKVVRERASGLYNWDVVLASTDPTVFMLIPIHALAPLRAALIDPSLSDDKTWIGGFAAGFIDSDKKYFYSTTGEWNTNLGFANRDCVAKDAFKSADDLKNPALRGKIAWYDPTLPGAGSRATWLLTKYKGEDWLKDMLTNHGVAFSRDYHQMTEWLVSCVKPIGIGMSNDVLPEMQKNGLGTHAEELLGPAYFGNGPREWTGANDDIGWYDKAPHPNAARIFVNWYLGRDFQQRYADIYHTDSRRTDTTPGDPVLAHALKPGGDYHSLSDEDSVRQMKELEERIKSWGNFG